MKTALWLRGTLLASTALPQSCEDHLAAGRALLAQTNLTAAATRFEAALADCPEYPDARLLMAVTRMESLWTAEAGSNFLTRLGIPSENRKTVGWSRSMPRDTNGLPIFSPGFKGREVTTFFLEQLVPVLVASGNDLAQITDTNYTLLLSSNEVSLVRAVQWGSLDLLKLMLELTTVEFPFPTPEESPAVETVADYGDILFLRAGLLANEIIVRFMGVLDLDLDLSTLQRYYLGPHAWNREQLLADHPSFLNLTGTNGLAEARLQALAAGESYLAASDFIAQRPTDAVRLVDANGDLAFVILLLDVVVPDFYGALTAPTPSSVESRIILDLRPLFAGQVNPRPLLPRFKQGGFVLRSAPDPTMAGTLPGLPAAVMDGMFNLLLGWPSVPVLTSSQGTNDGTIQIQVEVMPDRGYVLQSSTNLVDWEQLDAAVTLGFTWPLPQTPDPAADCGWYRVVDMGTNMPPPPNDDFARRAILQGDPAVTLGYNSGATREPAEPELFEAIERAGRSVWYSWTAPREGTVRVGTSASASLSTAMGVFTGESLDQLLRVAEGSYRLFFQATPGTTYQILIDGAYTEDAGGFRLTVAYEPPAPTLGLSGQTVGRPEKSTPPQPGLRPNLKSMLIRRLQRLASKSPAARL